MSLTVKQCAEYVEHTLGGQMGAPMSMRKLVNVTGEWLYTVQTWRFNVERHTLLPTRASISITAAAWNSGTKRITLAGAFAGYTHLSGDFIKITAGTGVSLGEYEIAQRIDDDNIELVNSIGTTNADTAGTMPNNTVSLPADLREIHAIDTDGASTEGFSWIGHESFAYGRTGRWGFASSHIRGSIIGIMPQAGGEVSYYLEIDPDQSASTNIWVRYSVGWRAVASDTSVLPLPDDGRLDSLFLQALIAHARGLDKEDEMPLYRRLDDLRASDFFRAHARRDGLMQAHLGPIQGSATTMRRGRYGGRWSVRTTS